MSILTLTNLIMLEIPARRASTPDSRLSTPSSSTSSSPALNPNTLALLDSFLSSKAEEEQRFTELSDATAGLTLGYGLDGDGPEKVKAMMSVEDYRLAFGEDWQLSQFCTIAFLCCPTAYVAFQHVAPEPLPNAFLFEFDQRFAVLAGKQYVFYDLDDPLAVPRDLDGCFDVVVADPPFLNERTNKKLIETVSQIIHPTKGKLILLTSTSMTDTLDELYAAPPLGPLHKTALMVEHGRLANDFACWGSWEGAKDFGLPSPANGDVQ
ncbi:putative N6-adenine methyltransferase-domain-containing protein [Infundibulicybe gibba]|nr:putative N6-adenine methyltransferase-domain-containing protein [Infundibulicybe gibba]